MSTERSVLVVGIGLVLGFVVALYGFLCVLSQQAYLFGRDGFFMLEGLKAVFSGMVLLGIGLLAHLQSLGYMERRYHKNVTIGSIVAVITIGVGLIGMVVLPMAGP